MAVLAGLLAVTACSDAAGPIETLSPDDAAFVAQLSGSAGELGPYLGPALRQIRARNGDAAVNGECEEMAQLRQQLRQHQQAGDSAAADQVRQQLRLRVAQMIHDGLGDGPLHEMLGSNERAMEQLRTQIQLRILLHGDTAAASQALREMVQLQERARLAAQQGRGAEALELAARVRERYRAHAGAGNVTGSDAAFLASVQARVGVLGEYMAAALVQVRSRQEDGAADGMRGEMEQLRDQEQQRLAQGDQAGAEEARYRLRLAAAYMIRAGLGDGPVGELLEGNEQLMTQLQDRIAERARLHQDTAGDQETLRTMQQLQEQARLAIVEGRHEEGLELAARVREWWRAREAAHAGA